ncbi:S-adenosyl-L-methionine-dependent methyltransferase [Diplogelasinospora grovesii]|uniref:S-adenosyl-L-methionine-dependent methyltransferase n=1 Tax=Diplogelasinospora grovesii TaxID=303347 RepID=A0AAN6SAI3_9PEZI|nr:S-adenosyl-L-methionine-dependent methyltransferase [Diplogelasinospora grovesii]
MKTEDDGNMVMTIDQPSPTPWQRDGSSSLALEDLLTTHPELFPHFDQSFSGSSGRRPRALVPRCGRGDDVLVLSSFGYDVIGLDVSAAAVQEGIANQLQQEAKTKPFGPVCKTCGVHDPRRGRGSVAWVTGDFLDATTWKSASPSGSPFTTPTYTYDGTFDLVFDYGYICTLPISSRPEWASRMVSLVNPIGGRLICWEWPIDKPGPRGLQVDSEPPFSRPPTWFVYRAHLLYPGKEIPYEKDGDPPLRWCRAPGGFPGTISDVGSYRVKPEKHKLKQEQQKKRKAGVMNQEETGETEEEKVIGFNISVWGHANDEGVRELQRLALNT